MASERAWIEELLYGDESAVRFTQDSPVLPDVWIAYAEEPNRRLDLLLTPHFLGDTPRGGPRRLSQELRERLDKIAKGDGPRGAVGHGIAYNASSVAARLSFDELVRAVLPMSEWYSQRVILRADKDSPEEYDMLAALAAAPKPKATRGRKPSAAPVTGIPNGRDALAHVLAGHKVLGDTEFGLTTGVAWMARVVGTIAIAKRFAGKKPDARVTPEVLKKFWPPPKRPDPALGAAVAAEAAAARIGHYHRVVDEVVELARGMPVLEGDERALLHSVSLNRPASATIWRSSVAVKADAAARVFGLSCRDLTWAVVDSGIDATHPAFRLRDEKQQPMAEPFRRKDKPPKPGSPSSPFVNQTRVEATYDFTLFRAMMSEELDDETKRILKTRFPTGEFVKNLKNLREALKSGREVEWDVMEPLLKVPHDDQYVPPVHEHGTHVAGILAADWRLDDPDFPNTEAVRGLCPDIRLYDLRVLDAAGRGDEFNVMAALQYIRSLNAHRDAVAIHGVNLSLSIPHDVANYACGRTPVCDECERLVGAGVVVVAAAGNDGYRGSQASQGAAVERGYRTVSISDPGNAESVITVGATHRDRPHEYGVSYFSSRGPTGDGRAKPDLVAPGEKIEAPVPGSKRIDRKDGTSMAAPHVSGAAALLMARHAELIGKPGRIKQALCATATDLGRERYFQGAGMLDILRALQSV